MTAAEEARGLFEDLEHGCLTRGETWAVQAIGTAVIALIAARVLIP